MFIDYIFNTIDSCVLCYILGLASGMFFELIVVLIVEKIGGRINEQ